MLQISTDWLRKVENKIEKIYKIEINCKEYPKQLLKLKRPPKILYAVGNIDLLQQKSIAVVGSRKCTKYGIGQTKKFAGVLSKTGITIISGLAEGIDTVAHEYSMKNEGKTIAVLASGFNHIFPEANKELFNQIIKNNSCIISEYPPNTNVNMKNFPIRNRIIAALSTGVLVIEAKYRSGSTITGRDALMLENPVFCIPNKIGEINGVGTNNLIKSGANLVTDVNDILSKIGEEILDKDKIKEINKLIDSQEDQISKENNIYKPINIDKQYMEIYECLIEKPLNIEELTRITNKSIVELNQKITIMEIEGLIETCPGSIIKLKST